MSDFFTKLIDFSLLPEQQNKSLSDCDSNAAVMSTLFLFGLWLHSIATDFTYEALRLLEEESETSENSDKLKDDKAHALLWLYICTLEKNLQKVTSFF